MNGRALVHRLAEAVEHTAEQARTDSQKGVVAAGDDTVAQLQAIDFFERHRKHALVAEADHLGTDGPAGRGADFAEVADRDHGAARGDQQPDHLGHFADPRQHLDIADVRDELADGGFSLGRHLPLQTIDQAALDLAQLCVDGGVQQALGGFKEDFALTQSRIGVSTRFLGDPLCSRIFRTEPPAWGACHAVEFARLQF